MEPAEIKEPENTRDDRIMLGMDHDEYRKMGEALQRNCFQNKYGDLCKIPHAKTKKLKNLRYNIRKSNLLMSSLIWKAQLRIIEFELQRRRGKPRCP